MSAHRRSERPRVVVSVLVLALLGCASGNAATSGSSSPGGGVAPAELTIFAAASLQSVFSELAAEYESARPRVRLIASYGASSVLRAQVLEGAPADVLASADTSNPEALADAGLAAGPVLTFARNRVVLVVPHDNPAGIRGPQDLARDGVRVVAAGSEVPITRYAQEAIRRLAALPAYPAGYADAVDANVISREDDVRGVLTRIELGEGDAAFVYATDVRAAVGVRVIELPREAEVATVCAAVALERSRVPEEAAAVVSWLRTPPAQAVLGENGFLPPA